MVGFINFLERLALLLAVLCVAAMMFIVSYDGFSRYVFRSPVPWAFEVVSYFLLSASVFLAGSATLGSGDHINLDLFRVRFRPAFRARVDGTWSILAAVAFGLITYGSAQEAIKKWTSGSFLYGYALWPAWIPYAIVFVGCAILTLRLAYFGMRLLIIGAAAEEDVEKELEL